MERKEMTTRSGNIPGRRVVFIRRTIATATVTFVHVIREQFERDDAQNNTEIKKKQFQILA